MVLGGFGVEISEEELCVACDCTFLGTDALKAVDAMRRMGFEHSAKHTLSLGELRMAVASGLFPIVFLSFSPISASRDLHAVVVLEAGEREVQILDPVDGERQIPTAVFSSAWTLGRNLAILVQP
jgi:ABC-type bacteriocin/lantibiotic exporter with double-glycine peptidase domain